MVWFSAGLWGRLPHEVATVKHWMRRMGDMKCANCSGEAQQVDSELDGIEINCPSCGHFGVSASVLRQRSGRIFDVEKTRVFLHNERDINPGRVPVIDSENVIWE